MLFSNELARRLNGTGATSNSLHPGSVKTELPRHATAAMNSVLVSITDTLSTPMLMRAPDGALNQVSYCTLFTSLMYCC